jgi:hypothetical protein
MKKKKYTRVREHVRRLPIKKTKEKKKAIKTNNKDFFQGMDSRIRTDALKGY